MSAPPPPTHQQEREQLIVELCAEVNNLVGMNNRCANTIATLRNELDAARIELAVLRAELFCYQTEASPET
jgi:hypothetical protein